MSYRASDQDVIGALDTTEWCTPERICEIISESYGGVTVFASALRTALKNLVQRGEVEARREEEVDWIFKLPVS